jgi:BirA family biotin operon repressor/biotin-[acetyl-CoA-carboxylase] ligase
VASTNERAHQGAAAGAPHGSVWVAEEQTAGRGRQGRTWTSPPGAGLLFSLLLRRRARDVAAPQLLPLALAVACCAALREATGLDIGIRWPNDLLLQRQKLAGILVEVRSAVPAVVVGVGINVRGVDLAQLGLPAATTLGQHVDPLPAREDLLARLLEAMRQAVDAWEAGDTDALLARWSRLDVLRGQPVRVVGAGAETRGIACGITEAGLLRVHLAAGGERTFSAAEVHLL